MSKKTSLNIVDIIVSFSVALQAVASNLGDVSALYDAEKDRKNQLYGSPENTKKIFLQECTVI